MFLRHVPLGLDVAELSVVMVTGMTGRSVGMAVKSKGAGCLLVYLPEFGYSACLLETCLVAGILHASQADA